MSLPYFVIQGDTMASIAKKNQFFDWQTVYFAPENEPLRKLRPNPNLLFPGDLVTIPDKRPKLEEAETGKRHTFFVGGMRHQIRIILKDLSGEPLRRMPYELVLGDRSITDATDNDGLLQAELPIDMKTATLKIRGYAWNVAVGELNPMPATEDNGVSGAQGRLHNLGYDVGRRDGVIGPRTSAALRLFQEHQGIQPADGNLTSQTEQALAQVHGC